MNRSICRAGCTGSGGPKKRFIRGGPDPPWKRHFRGVWNRDFPARCRRAFRFVGYMQKKFGITLNFPDENMPLPCGLNSTIFDPLLLLLLLFFGPRYSIPREWKNYAVQYKKVQKSSWNEPYSSSPFTKQSCSKMALYRWIRTESRWNKKLIFL